MGLTLTKVVALIVLTTVVSSAQCVNWCAVHPCDEEPSSQPVDAAQSCHHSKTSSNTESSQPTSNCSHQPVLVSEKVSRVSPSPASFQMLPQSFAHAPVGAAYLAPFQTERWGSPPTQVTTNTVLRI
jgi:hypothetical protein